MSTTTTQAQQFATAYAATMARSMLATIRYVRWAATAIMLIAMLVSYTHQAGYLASIGTPAMGAWLIPGALDALTFLCVKVLGTPGMAQPAKTVALRVLVFPVLASGAINFIGPGELVTKCVFVLAVLMIPAAELVASRIKPDFVAMDTMERGMAPAAPAPEVDQTERQRRSEIAKRAAHTLKQRRAAEAGKKEAQREARRQREAAKRAELNAPVSPAWAIEGRQPSAAEVAAITF